MQRHTASFPCLPTEGLKVEGENPHNFFIYSLITSAIVRLSLRRSLGVLLRQTVTTFVFIYRKTYA